MKQHTNQEKRSTPCSQHRQLTPPCPLHQDRPSTTSVCRPHRRGSPWPVRGANPLGVGIPASLRWEGHSEEFPETSRRLGPQVPARRGAHTLGIVHRGWRSSGAHFLSGRQRCQRRSKGSASPSRRRQGGTMGPLSTLKFGAGPCTPCGHEQV